MVAGDRPDRLLGELVALDGEAWVMLQGLRDGWLDSVIADLDGQSTPATLSRVDRFEQALARYEAVVRRICGLLWP